MPQRFVRSGYEGGVATITLDRPPLNLMNIEMMEEINAALLELRDHPELKALVIRGSGDIFSAGVDLHDHTRDRVSRLLQVFHRIFETIRLLDVVTITAVHGRACGGGFALALGGNLVVATESARFGLPEINMGLFSPLPAVILPRAGPRRKAMEWILMGDEVTAQELNRFGLVNRIVPDDAFEAGIGDVVSRITSKSGPVLALAKRAQTESYYSTYEEALYKVENLYLRELMALTDPQEGIEAFLEKREPRWRNA